jgi:hypothetical protein
VCIARAVRAIMAAQSSRASLKRENEREAGERAQSGRMSAKLENEREAGERARSGRTSAKQENEGESWEYTTGTWRHSRRERHA